MRYSIFDWGSRKYHYFDAPGPSLGDVVPPGNSVSANSTVNPECVLAKLPAGAKKIGEGCQPLGRIAVTKQECNTTTTVSSKTKQLLVWLFITGAVTAGGLYLMREI